MISPWPGGRRAVLTGCAAAAVAVMAVGRLGLQPASPFDLTALCLAGRLPASSSLIADGWSLAPEVVGPLSGLLLAWWLLHRRGNGTGSPPGMFLAGWLLLALALVSPLCRLAAATASGHMAQHAILVALAPPLLVAGSGPWARTTNLRLASLVYGAVIWLVHAPRVYEAALVDPAIHLLVLAAMVTASAVFWHAVLFSPAAGAAILALLVAMLHTGLLGALLTFAPSPWYPLFAGGPQRFGLSPLEDQQLAGLLMWIPMGGVYMGVALGRLGRLLARTAVAPPLPVKAVDRG